jgi:hypothetical protein
MFILIEIKTYLMVKEQEIKTIWVRERFGDEMQVDLEKWYEENQLTKANMDR